MISSTRFKWECMREIVGSPKGTKWAGKPNSVWPAHAGEMTIYLSEPPYPSRAIACGWINLLLHQEGFTTADITAVLRALLPHGFSLTFTLKAVYFLLHYP